MSRKNNLTDIWNVYSNNIIKESTKEASPCMRGGIKSFGTKPGKGPVSTDSKAATDIQNKKTSDTTEVDGYEEPIDPKTMSKKKKKGNLYSPGKFSSEKFDEKVEKTYKDNININMKSVFDKLFEDVMGDQDMEELDALGIDTDDEANDVEETDEVTLTLDRETAQKLHDMLMTQLEGEDEDEGEDDGEVEDGFEDFEDTVDEATDLKEVPDSAGQSLMSRKNTVGSVRASGGKASADVKIKVDANGKPLPDAAGHKLTSKKNKVHSKKTGSTGDLFA
jgi:hypothetical protein